MDSDTTPAAAEPSGAVLEPQGQPVEIQLSPDVAAKLTALEYAAVTAALARDEYQAGLCAGLGIDRRRVMSLDVANGKLILTPDP